MGAFILEAIDIIAGIIFVVGSACFLPQYSKDLDVFIAGCVLFVVGAALYCIICTFTLAEALHESGCQSFETSENVLYLAGSYVYFIGTVLYWPSEAHQEHIEAFKDMSLGQYFNLFEPEFEGTVLFIVGSVMFAFAAFLNGLNQRRFDLFVNKLLTATTSLYMGGSLLFAMGSMCFLPNLGCGEQMVTIGAWMFIIGSVMFVIGGCLSMYRLLVIYRNKDVDEVPLVDGPSRSRSERFN